MKTASAVCLLFFAALLACGAGTIRFGYDAAGRLVSADYAGGKTIQYVYDPNGNLLQRLAQVGAISQADLAILKSGLPLSFQVGQGNLIYTLTVTNAGPNTASNVTVSDVLPVNVLFASASAGAVNEGVFTAGLGDLAMGAKLDIRLEVVPLATGALVNVASVTNTVNDPNLANNTAIFTNVVLAAADTNANGLADWWEEYWFTNPADRVSGDLPGRGAPTTVTDTNALPFRTYLLSGGIPP